MDERVLQFRIGVMVVGTVFIAAFLVLAFNYDPALCAAVTRSTSNFPKRRASSRTRRFIRAAC